MIIEARIKDDYQIFLVKIETDNCIIEIRIQDSLTKAPMSRLHLGWLQASNALGNISENSHGYITIRDQLDKDNLDQIRPVLTARFIAQLAPLAAAQEIIRCVAVDLFTDRDPSTIIEYIVQPAAA